MSKRDVELQIRVIEGLKANAIRRSLEADFSNAPEADKAAYKAKYRTLVDNYNAQLCALKAIIDTLD